MTVTWLDILVFVKYIAATIILLAIILAPSWLARQTKKDKVTMGCVRICSWLFCWSGIGWLCALFWSVKK